MKANITTGLGLTTSKFWKNKSSRDYRKYISNHQITIDDTYGISKAVQLQVQGQWTRGLNYNQQDFTWVTLIAMSANLTSFYLHSTFDTLPSPIDLKRWRITTEVVCTLCSKGIYTTTHILEACKVSLQQGRYTFRHDTVWIHHHLLGPKKQIFKRLQEVYIKPQENNLRYLCHAQSYPTASSGSVDKMDKLHSARFFLRQFNGDAS